MQSGTFACLAAGLIAGAAHGAQQAVEVQLAVRNDAARIWVEVRLRNRTVEAVMVPRSLATEHELSGRLFEIRDAGSGVLLDYEGKMVKRGPLTEADFVRLGPNASLRNRIDLSGAYAFRPGSHAYILSYADYYRANGEEKPLTAAPVRFDYTVR